MSDLQTRIQNLSPEKRKLLKLRFSGKSVKTYPLSYAQQRLWFLDQLEPGSAAYNRPIVLRLTGLLHKHALLQSMNEIVSRHEVLRTSFILRQDQPVQQVAPEVKLSIGEIDLSSWGEAGQEDQVQSAIQLEASEPFDLSQGPLLRMKLLRLNEQEHVFLITMHHIVSDGWSMAVLVREFSHLYETYARGKESSLEELPIQYGQFGVWQRQWLQGAILEKQLGYWRRQLDGVPVLELPTDHERPAVMSHRGAKVIFLLEKSLSEQLRQLSRHAGLTLFMTLLAGFQVLLSKYSGQQDVAVGTAIANRNRADIEKLIGFFVNTLLLRTDLSGNPTFKELLARVRTLVLEAYEHQDLPFEKLVEELQPEREMSRTPLVQVMFLLQNLEYEALQLPGLRVTREECDPGFSKFDLTMALNETSRGLEGVLSYASDLYESATMENLVSHWQVVLEKMVSAPEQRIGEVSLLRGRERQQILVEWNRSEAECPQGCMHELFEKQTQRQPSAIAVEWEATELSYEELDRRANQLGHYLKKFGVRPETRVGICMARGVEMVVALLGVLKAGGAYVPLDPAYPQERLQFMMEDAQATLLVTERRWAERFSGCQAELIFFEEMREESDCASGTAVFSGVRPENLAYLIYTSGSTGRPKGVAITHQSANALLYWARNVFSVEELAGVLASTSICFDLSVFELFVPLSWGGTVLMAENALSLPQWMASERVKLVNTVPSAMTELVRMNGIPRSVRVVNLAGEALQRGLVEKIYEQGEVGRVLNLYGPSEDTTYSTWACVKRGEKNRSVSIGRAVTNTQAYVLDTEGRYEPLPVGAAGELYLGGAGLARGYLNRPELTAERFVPNPFSQTGGERLYRTGDRVRWQRDGQLEFLGRLDQQVKIRGFRIELDEIQAGLQELPGVRQAVVIAREDEPGNKRLVAYVAARQRGALRNSQLQEQLKKRLPDYMVPSVYVQMDELPLTPNGKVDRKRLPFPEEAAIERGQGPVAPRNEEEEILCGIWEQVLKLERVRVEENFFDLGGHSLLATQVIVRVRQVFSVNLPLRALFEAPTVSGLAKRIREEKQKGMGTLAPTIQRAGRKDPAPLSFAQQRLWFLDQLEPGSATYNLPTALRLQGELKIEALVQALSAMVRRHEVLRTTFKVIEGEPRQVVSVAAPLPLPLTDLSTLPLEIRETEAQRAAHGEAAKPFDLAQGPLIRGQILKLSEEEHILLITVHHIASDGWSAGIMVREFAALYEAYVAGQDSPLPELEIQYGDFAIWQRDWLHGEALDEPLAYWRNQLEGLEPVELPTDYGRTILASRRCGQVRLEIGESQSRKLRNIARQEGVTLFMVLLAALDVVMWRYSGQNDVAVGTATANRNRVEIEGLIGFFVNTLVLRTQLNGRTTAREFLKDVGRTSLEAYRYQDVPFEKLVEELQPDRDLARSPFFQVVLILQNLSREPFALPHLTVSEFQHGYLAAKSDLRFMLEDSAATLRGGIAYAADLYQQATVERLAQHWQQVLTELAANLDRPLSHISLMGEEERRQILQHWSGKEESGYWSGGIGASFGRQANLTPQMEAVIWDEGQITYKELSARARQIGRYLRDLGVRPEQRVAICLEPGPDLIACVLAVVAVGAAYVPLDPDYPAERLCAIVSDTQPLALISDEKLKEKLPSGAGTVLCISQKIQEFEQQDEEAFIEAVQPENVVYVIYTSGSTGKAKGVAVTQEGLASRIAFVSDLYQSGPGDRCLQILSPSFDAFAGGLFSMLHSGGAVVFAKPQELLEPAGLLAVLQKRQITQLRIPVGYLQQLLSYAYQHGLLLPQSLRLIVTGGETVSRLEIRNWLKRCAPSTRFIHEYGPTETTITASSYEDTLDTDSTLNAHRFVIGRPNANTRLYVLGEDMEVMATGAVGELFIAGAGLSRGYEGNAAATAEKYVPNPLSSVHGERLYKTGDWARWMSDGNLEFLGRRDGQVKIHGYRIELGEIEATLRKHWGIKDAVVVLREHSRDRQLHAYVVPATMSTFTSAELRTFLQERLPQYMVPSVFVTLTELPLLPGGKIDRKRLPEPEESGREDQYVGPRTAEEEILCGMWAEVLKQERVGIEDNFFELGGHSLLATQLMARVRKVFKVELALRELFEAPTIAGLGNRMREQRGKGKKRSVPGVKKGARGGRLPLSYAQQRLWFLDQLQPNSAVYNIPMALRLKGELEVGVVERVLEEMVRRHEVLRTRIEGEGGEAWQVIDEAGEVKLGWVDLSGVEGKEEREEETRKRVQEEAERPFDLQREWLFRGQVLRLGEDEHVLLLTMHHIVSDEWSMRIMVREFVALYQAYHAGLQSPLKDLELQYADFALWQRNWLQGEVLEEELAYWKGQLSDLPTLQLPVDHQHSWVAIRRGGTAPFQLDRELCNRLKQLCRREGTTPYMGMLGLFQVFLAKYTGQKDIAVGSPIANRPHAWTQDLIGFFSNMIILRTKLHSDPGFLEVLDRVRKVTLDGYEHQDLPFDLLMEAIPSMRNKAQSPLQAVLSFHTARSEKLELSSLQVTNVGLPSNSTAKFDLTLHIMSNGEQMNGAWEYNAELFEEETIRQMTGHLVQLLRSVVDDPAAPISRLQILSPKDTEILRQATDIEDFVASDFAFEEQPLIKASKA